MIAKLEKALKSATDHNTWTILGELYHEYLIKENRSKDAKEFKKQLDTAKTYGPVLVGYYVWVAGRGILKKGSACWYRNQQGKFESVIIKEIKKNYIEVTTDEGLTKRMEYRVFRENQLYKGENKCTE